MTIIINDNRTASAKYVSFRAASAPVDTWDLMEGSAVSARGSVRTLEEGYRTSVDYREGLDQVGQRIETAIENEKEKRASLILGGVLGLALLIGSAFGGVFSGEEVDPAPSAPNVVTATTP